MAEKLIRCEKCGAEYPESWGECQCVTVAGGAAKEAPKEKPKEKDKK